MENLLKIDSLAEAKDSFERIFIKQKLNENEWNITKTAHIIGIERANLHRKINTLQIAPPSGRQIHSGRSNKKVQLTLKLYK